jgi:hypothetical protein
MHQHNRIATKHVTVSYWRPDGSHVASFEGDIPLADMEQRPEDCPPAVEMIGNRSVIVSDSFGPWDGVTVEELREDAEERAVIDGLFADELVVVQYHEDEHGC